MPRKKLPIYEEVVTDIVQVIRRNALKVDNLYYVTVDGEAVYSVNGLAVKTFRTETIALANVRKSMMRHNGLDLNTARRYVKELVSKGIIEVKKVEIEYKNKQTDESTGIICGE